jgi:hypothetical protein
MRLQITLQTDHLIFFAHDEQVEAAAPTAVPTAASISTSQLGKTATNAVQAMGDKAKVLTKAYNQTTVRLRSLRSRLTSVKCTWFYLLIFFYEYYAVHTHA